MNGRRHLLFKGLTGFFLGFPLALWLSWLLTYGGLLPGFVPVRDQIAMCKPPASPASQAQQATSLRGFFYCSDSCLRLPGRPVMPFLSSILRRWFGGFSV